MTTETLRDKAIAWMKYVGLPEVVWDTESLTELLQSVHAQGRREEAEENRSRVLQLEELVDQAALWLEEYAQLHLSKETDEGRAKAKRNERRAKTMRKGLLTTPEDGRGSALTGEKSDG